MQHILLIEPDRTVSKCIKDELLKSDIKVSISTNASDAITLADELNPDAIVTEISLAGHSGTEFLYEFRTYPDWTKIPIIIYSSMKIPEIITSSNDWKQLNIKEVLYKPNESLSELATSIQSIS